MGVLTPPADHPLALAAVRRRHAWARHRVALAGARWSVQRIAEEFAHSHLAARRAGCAVADLVGVLEDQALAELVDEMWCQA